MDSRNGKAKLCRIRLGGSSARGQEENGEPAVALRPPSPVERSAFKESLRRFRPPGLDLMLLAQGADNHQLPAAEAPDPGFRRWETYPRRKRNGSFSTSSSSSLDATPVTRNQDAIVPLPRRLVLMSDTHSNHSMLLQEAISESLCFPPGEAGGGGGGGGNASSRDSPSPEAETSAYYSPVLPDFFDNVTSSRLPSNIKELQMHLKAAQDECFTLKMSLHFLEEDYKRSLGAEDLTKENVNLKVEVVQLKDVVAKKNQLLHSALVVLQKSENPDLAAKEAEWAAERKEMEQSMKDMEQLWTQRVAELEYRLGLARDSSEPTSVGSTATDAVASGSYKIGTSSHDAQSPVSESVSSLEHDNSDKLQVMKRQEQELNSLHSAVKEKDMQIQQLMSERNKFLEDTHQKVADLMALCSAKDVDISRLQAICKKQQLQDQDNNNNYNRSDNVNNQNQNNENTTDLLNEIQRLKATLEQTKEEKVRVIEEAEIMDQQQQELSEQIQNLNEELKVVKQEKSELVARLSVAERKDRDPAAVAPRREGSEDVLKLTEELVRLQKESSEKDQRLRDALQEKKALQERCKEQQQHDERARTKLTTTKASSRPLFEPKVRRSSTGSRSDHESHPSVIGIQDETSTDIVASEHLLPRDCFSPAGNLPFTEGHDFLSQDLEGLTFDQLRERLLKTEALCWSMQSHLEDMAEFFSALLGNGDIKRFEKTLTPREVRKLRCLLDRTMNISVSVSNHTNRNQSDFLINFTSSMLQESEPENDSRDRELSVLSVTSHVKSFKDFGSGSETESVAIRSSGCGEQAGRSRRSRLSSTTDQSQLAPSLVQGLLEVLRRTEQSSQKLCSELESFGQSHLYKLLVEEILDKLKQENLLQGAVPGQEWEEVSQELESFRRKSQEVIQAAAVARGCLKDGLEHLSRKSLSMVTSVQPEEEEVLDKSLLPVSASGAALDEDKGSAAVGVMDKSWVKTLVDAHYSLALTLDAQVQRLYAQSNRSCGDGGYAPWGSLDWSQLSKDLLDVWDGGQEVGGSRPPTWYKERLVILPKAMSLLQQVVRNMFSTLTECLEDSECAVKESTERLRMMEANQECRLKEIRQIQDWNLRLQAEQKSKENILQSLKARETELAQKVKDQMEEIEMLREKSQENIDVVNVQLHKASTELDSLTRRNMEMADAVKARNTKIDKQVAELESQKGLAQDLNEKLNATQTKLVAAQEREKMLSDLLNEAVESKSQLESFSEDLKDKTASNDVSSISNSKLCLEAATSRLNIQLEEALSKIVLLETKEKDLVEKIRRQTEEIQRLYKELEYEQERKYDETKHGELKVASEKLKGSSSREGEMVEKIRNQNLKLEKLTLELESEKKCVRKLRGQLDDTLLKLETVETREKTISGLMEKAVNAKNELEVSVQDFKSGVQKDTAEKYENDLKKTRICLETTTAKLKHLEKQCLDLQRELAESTEKYKSSEESLIQKLACEQEEQVRLQVETRLTMDKQSREFMEAKAQAKRISQELESTLTKLEKSEMEIQSRVAEVEEVHSRIKSLEMELEEMKENARKSRSEVELCHHKERKIRKEWKATKSELELVRKELSLVTAECEVMRKNSLSGEGQQKLVDVESPARNAEKIMALERQAARLQEEVQKSNCHNQELQTQLRSYEEAEKAIHIAPAIDIVYNHPLTSDDDQMPNKAPSKLVKSDSRHSATDLLGEMKELKKEVVRNNQSSARLCRELQQHGHLHHRQQQQHPAGSAVPQQRSALKGMTDSSRSSKSPDSASTAAKRKQLLEGMNGDTSSGTGSAETLTLLTASSETSFSSNPATSSEDLGSASRRVPVVVPARHKETSISKLSPLTSGKSPKAAHESQFGSATRRGSASEERWARKSASPLSSRTSSESSLLHLKVLRQLGEDSERQKLGLVDSVSDQDRTQNGDSNPFFQYEGPLVLVLSPGSSEGAADGEGRECVLQRSNYSSPDLGIESDPNLVSSRSSSTSSSESRPQPKGRISSGGNEKDAQRVLVPCHQPKALARQSEELEANCLKKSSIEPLRATRIFDPETEKPSDNPGMMLHGLCPLKDLELLRQELEEAQVTLQGTKATVRNRLDSKKISSPAKSLEYSTLKEVDTRCLQLGEYLLRCRKLLDTFCTLPVVTTPSWPRLQTSSASSLPSGQRLQLLDSNELSLTASTETVCYKGDVQKGTDECEALREQVLNLENKLQALEKQYNKALEQIKANKNKTKLVNKALEKQLSATTKVIKMAKGNLKQSGAIEVVMYQESDSAKNKCS